MSEPAVLILNVDDNETGRYVKSHILRLAGFEVVEAATGAAALAAMEARHPALVLLDVKLPDMNGRSICARIKGHDATANIVVLQTSASHIETQDRVQSLDAGADGYLVEPINPAELVATVRALLRMRQAENERQKALADLREADRRKDEFLAMLAHELRNPLAPIRNAVEILKSDAAAERESARQLIGRQVDHLARLVDDLLEVSRITRGKVVLQPAIVPLQGVLHAAVDVARSVLQAQRHELAVEMPQENVWLEIDPMRFAQVVGNLLHNAAKFTPRRGRIGLRARVGEDAVEIEVSDNGVGISASDLPRVFELFSQSDRSLERAQGGLGIGLSLVKGLVEMHGGTVSAHSEGAGTGSVFGIRLPLSLIRARPEPRPSPAQPPSSALLRVLVVEDNVDAAETMRIVIEKVGHEVAVVNDGGDALDAAARLCPEVILLDIGLPGIDGYELVRRLRTRPEMRATRIIAISGYGQAKDRERSIAAGFDLHLVKPVDPARLLAVIAG